VNTGRSLFLIFLLPGILNVSGMECTWVDG
jgi:hypothetical protein